MRLPFDRVVVWGHKPRYVQRYGIWLVRRHTHSYIHEGYFRAFSYLGFSTSWLEDEPASAQVDLRRALVLTEDQADLHLPAVADCSYVLHHSTKAKYAQSDARVLNLANFTTVEVEKLTKANGIDSNWKKLDDVTFYDSRSRTLYQPWATNLLPTEINTHQTFTPSRSQKFVHYVGTTRHDNIPHSMRIIRQHVKREGLCLKVHSGVDDVTAEALMYSSRTSFDVRGTHHRNVGYIPCRIWKGLSYGIPMTSNSPKLHSIFGDRVNFAFSDMEMLDSSITHTDSSSYDQINDNKSWIKNHHTFVNRALRILEILS